MFTLFLLLQSGPGQEGCAHWTWRGHRSRVCPAAGKVGPGVVGTDQKAEPRPVAAQPYNLLSLPGAAPETAMGDGPPREA